MKAGQIQLGVKRSSGKSLDRFLTQGFFYGGGVPVNKKPIKAERTASLAKQTPVQFRVSARQHLILQTICAGRWGWWSSLVAHQFGRLEVAAGKPRSGTDRQAGFKSRPFPLKVGNIERCPAPAHLFYDNPSQKRV